MSGLSPQVSVLLSGLSDFWQRFFADKDQLEALYAATEEQLGQAYLDIVSNVLNSNIQHTQLFHREYWHLYTARYDAMRYVDGEPYPYRCPASEGMVSAQFLWNRVYAPTAALESPQDFEVVNSEIRFATNPFEATGVVTRDVEIAPTTYLSTRGASVSGTTMTWNGEVARGLRGITRQGYLFEVGTDTFTEADLGRQLTHMDPANKKLTVTRTITSVISPRVVSTDVLLPDNSGLTWQVFAAGHFNLLHPGTTITFVSAGVSYSAKIVSITSPLEVELDTAIAALDTLTDLVWTHTSASRVPLMSWWSPDTLFDQEDLFLSFGYLVQKYEPSSEAYRALILGLMRYYTLGPTPGRIESALNVMVGVPVIRTDGETLVSVTQATDLLDIVTTSAGTYTIPHGSFRTELSVGYVFSAFESLTTVFRVQDHVTDPTWYHGETIPEDILPGRTAAERAVDPQLYAALIGVGRWAIGDPQLIVGADVTGGTAPVYEGLDMFVNALDDTVLEIFQEYIDPTLVGATVWIDNIRYTCEAIAAAPDLTIQVSNTSSALVSHTPHTSLATTLVPGNDLIVLHDYVLAENHVGRKLRVTTSVNVPQEVYEIYDVVAQDTVRVRRESGAAASLPAEANYTVEVSKAWSVQPRPPLQSTTGYVLMHDMLKHHIFSVEYRLSDFPAVPYPRLTEDLREALFEGRPAYTYLLLRAISSVRDTVKVADDLAVTGFLSLTNSMTETNAVLRVGDPVVAGEFYTYVGLGTAWLGMIRVEDMGSPFDTGVSGVDDAVFRLTFHNPDPTFEIDCQVETFDGLAWNATGAPFVLSPAAPGPVTVAVNTDPVRLVTSVTASAQTFGIEYGADHSQRILFRQHPVASTSTTGAVNADVFTDASVSFTAKDVYRELYLEVASVYRRVIITDITDEHTVQISDPATWLPTSFAPTSGIDWYFAAQRRYATPVSVAGASPVVPRGAGGSITSWPLQLLLEPAVEPSLP